MSERIAEAKGVSPARRVAFDLLRDLRQRPETHSDELLHSGQVNRLSSIDRNLATALVMGVLRWQLALDDRIGAYLTRGSESLAEPVEVALELGALQLLLLDRIPPHAAIYESVELVKRSGNAHAAGLVNAVLRKLVGAPKLGVPPLHFRAAEQVARVWAHPLWMVARWTEIYGLKNTVAICQFGQYPQAAAIRLREANAETLLQEEGIELAPADFVAQARRVVGEDVTATRAFAQGLVRIQDESSQLIAELARPVNANPDALPYAMLDCCAAPGGKTAILAERNPRARIVASDISAKRLQAVRALLGPESDRIAYSVLDATNMRFETKFDLVLCDAPCSGTGTLARNPEIRHRLDLEDLSRQQSRQVEILTRAMEAAKGSVLYSTCSLEPEENEHVVRRALSASPGFRLLSISDRVMELEREGVLHAGSAARLFANKSTPEFLRTIPGVHRADGFFAALLVRDSR